MPVSTGPDSYIVTLATTWKGERVYAQQACPAEMWSEKIAREALREYLLNALGVEIAKRLDVELTARPVTPWEMGPCP